MAVLGDVCLAAKKYDNPCKDKRYLKLKAKDIDELSKREYDLFKDMHKSCNDYRYMVRQNKGIEKMSKSSNIATWLLVGLSIIPLLLFL